MKLIVYDSPVGPLTLASDGQALTGLAFETQSHPCRAIEGAERGRDGVLDAARRQLDLYFAGKLKRFDLALNPQGTAFQKRVWMALRAIPFGKTVSYANIADEIGAPKAVRAVGGANGRNPIAIVVPCHRVIGANGSLTGFGGGMERKQFLLALEQGQKSLAA
ncbi:MAG TPA: methylated-DNA--[protein]-cysteine S-methyltransferase [Caulobacterales bacterium]|jgi:methylated-DNA-[protein]-cysteine S-methyltransferase|nr:methylated-DNA--[protein]-cysteine S-methyltransferase [Caulobacterales bacterium]